MQQNTVVTYTLRPEAYDEHVRLIRGVFAQLDAERPEGLDYRVWCLADGVSFVHISAHDTPDGANPLTQLSAFQEFGRDLGARVATPPNPSAAEAIGRYSALGA